MWKWTWPLIALCAASQSSFCAAQDSLPEPKELFKQLDKNGDGLLERSELTPEQARFFDRLLRNADKNEDGKLSHEEFLQGHKPEEGPGLPLNGLNPGGGRGLGDFRQRFEMLDKNKDGKVTRDEIPDFARERLSLIFERLGKDELTLEEFQRMERPGDGNRPQGPSPEQLFGRFDTNGDGKINADDQPQDRARPVLEQILRRLGKKPEDGVTKEEFVANFPRPPEGERRPEGDGMRGPLFVRLLDTDHDGRISKAEWAKAGELFAELDKNQDGEIDMPELMGPPPEGREEQMPGRDRPAGIGNAPRPFFDRLDRDGDGKLSREEAPPRLQDRFDQLDSDKDGKLSFEELRSMFPGGPNGARPEKSEDRPRDKRPPQE